MHKLTVVMFVYTTLNLQATAGDFVKEVQRLLPALIQVESSGRDWVIGDRALGEKAYGPLQIRKPVVEDVNRVYGTHYEAKQMLGNRKLSIEVCEKYLRIYATPKRIGAEPTAQHLARIWNGGPEGWRYSSTKKYWRKVQRHLS